MALLLVAGGLVTPDRHPRAVPPRNFYQRIHGPAITVTLGAGCILVASMIHFQRGRVAAVLHELLIGLRAD